jgi:hypothetical protein
MGCKIIIAPPLKVLLHFIERFANGRSQRIEYPSAFGATPAQKTLFFDPYQFALHVLLSTALDLVRLSFCERRRDIVFLEHDCDDKRRLLSGRNYAPGGTL